MTKWTGTGGVVPAFSGDEMGGNPRRGARFSGNEMRRGTGGGMSAFSGDGCAVVGDVGQEAVQRPWKVGSRLSTKAWAALRWSSLWPQWMWWVTSRSMQSIRSAPLAARLMFSFWNR